MTKKMLRVHVHVLEMLWSNKCLLQMRFFLSDPKHPLITIFFAREHFHAYHTCMEPLYAHFFLTFSLVYNKFCVDFMHITL